jgi:ABC-2 type transport system ATP-binding protein
VHAQVATAARRLPEIVRDLDAAGVQLDDLSIRHPSLDDVFLTLTGHATGGSGTTESERP